MTFEDLQTQWNRQNQTLDTMLQLNLAQIRATHFDSLATALDRVRRVVWTELLLTAAALIPLGSFLFAHRGDVRYLLPAAILHLSAIAFIAGCANQLIAARAVDYSGPVVHAQRRLTALRRARIRTSKWTLLVAPALWTPLVIVLMKSVLPIDVYATFNARWIAANIVFSLAFIPLMLWIAHRYGERLSRSPLMQRLADDLAGRSLNEATAFANRLAEFEGSVTPRPSPRSSRS